MKRRDDPNQTLINWNNPSAAAVAPQSSIPDPVKLAARALPVLIERLPWDFTTTFPQPTDEAIEAGRLYEEDCTPENVKSIHDEHARELLTTLHDLDAVMDARRRGLDPSTGKPPRTHASRERLRRLYETEPPRLERAFNNMMEVYEEAFGPESAHAFNRFIRARHAGIPVELDHTAKLDSSVQNSAQPLKDAPSPAKPKRHHAGSSSLPAPRPLPDAVKAGHFGIEDGKPI